MCMTETIFFWKQIPKNLAETKIDHNFVLSNLLFHQVLQDKNFGVSNIFLEMQYSKAVNEES
jgi:hypothetical protein